MTDFVRLPSPLEAQLGLAAQEPQQLCWRTFHGGQARGQGTVFEDTRQYTTASYNMSSDFKRMTFSISADTKAPRTYRLEIPFSFPPAYVALCDGTSAASVLSSSFAPKHLETLIIMDSTDGNACVTIDFVGALNDPLLNSSYVVTRTRAHQLKQQIDNALLNPKMVGTIGIYA